jgi:putative zinc finger/helix-turn-helix YgiT family protein
MTGDDRTMNCTECGATMTTRKENYRYLESGLPYVTLKGIDVSRCPACGNFEISIPRLKDLHRLIAKTLIEKMTRFTGAEIRFLRKSLGLSATDFSRRMGVTVETVSRWENNAVAIGPQADRLLRLLVAQGRLTMQYPEEQLDRIDTKNATEMRFGVKLEDEEWAVDAA